MLGVCDGYDRVEAVSEGGLACTNSLPFPLPFLRESTCILLSSSAPVPFPADAVEDAPKLREEETPLQQICSNSGAVYTCAQLQVVPKKNRCHTHHHCVLDCIRKSSS